MADKVAASQENNEGVTEDGIEDAFEVGVNTRCWIIYFLNEIHANYLHGKMLYCCGYQCSVSLESSLCYFLLLQVQGEIQEIVKTGLWVGDCFIYTSSVNRLNYYVGGEIVTIAHLDRYKMQPFLLEKLKRY